MSDIALFQFICKVCGVSFWSYTECRIKRLWNEYMHSFEVELTSAYGSYDEGLVYFREDSIMPMVENKPIPNERKCGKCRRGSQLEEYL